MRRYSLIGRQSRVCPECHADIQEDLWGEGSYVTMKIAEYEVQGYFLIILGGLVGALGIMVLSIVAGVFH